jgi:hypothetical protein
VLVLFLILALIFFIGGGAGLFYVNTALTAHSQIWVVGNIAFGVFVLVGVVILVFAALFNAEFE